MEFRQLVPLPTAVETRTILQNRCLKSDTNVIDPFDPCQMLSPQHFPLAIQMLSNSGLPGFILLCIPGVQVDRSQRSIQIQTDSLHFFTHLTPPWKTSSQSLTCFSAQCSQDCQSLAGPNPAACSSISPYLKTTNASYAGNWDQGLALLLHFFGHCSLVMIPRVRGLKAKSWSEFSVSDGTYTLTYKSYNI